MAGIRDGSKNKETGNTRCDRFKKQDMPDISINESRREVYKACIYFSFASVGMLLANKGIIRELNSPWLLVLSQNLISSAFFLFKFKFSKNHSSDPLGGDSSIKELFLQHSLHWMPAVVLFCVNIVTSMVALSYISVATFSVLRNLNPFISSIMTFFFFGEITNGHALWALVIILGGSIFYAHHDLELNISGYIVCFIHITSMSAYSCVVKYLSRQVVPLEMAILNNVMSIPIITSISFCLGELDIVVVQDFFAHAFGGGVATFWFLASCILGCCISFTAFACQSQISPTSFLTLNNINKIPAILLSVVLFNGQMSLSMVAGLTTSLFGGYYFALVTMPGSDSKEKPWRPWRVLIFVLVCMCALPLFESTFEPTYFDKKVLFMYNATKNNSAQFPMFNNNSHPIAIVNTSLLAVETSSLTYIETSIVSSSLLKFSTLARGCAPLPLTDDGLVPFPSETYCRIPRKGLPNHLRFFSQTFSFYWRYAASDDDRTTMTVEGLQCSADSCDWSAPNAPKRLLLTSGIGAQRAQGAQYLAESAKNFGINEVRIFSDSDLQSLIQTDPSVGQNLHWGSGYWKWKPRFVKQVLETLVENDIIFWVDSDSKFLEDPSSFFCAASKRSVISFEIGSWDAEITKRDTYIALGADEIDFYNSHQILTGAFLIRNDPVGREFVRLWTLASYIPRIWDRIPSMLGQDHFDYAHNSVSNNHQVDQSVFSILVKLAGFKTYPSPFSQTWGPLLPETQVRSRRQAGLFHGNLLQHDTGCDHGLPNPGLSCPYQQWMERIGANFNAVCK